LRAALDIPRAGWFFEGHFPGRPILPGIALLDLALRALDPPLGPETLVRLDHLRLRCVVLPGERLDVEAHGAAGERVRCSVRRGEERVAEADLVFGSHPSGRTAPANPSPAVPLPRARDLDALLPHRPPMRLVAGIEKLRDDGVVCTARLEEDGPFTVNRSAPALAAIEMAAQAAAVFAGLRSADEPGPEEPRAGYLVGARGVRFFRAAIPAGAVCTAAVRWSGRAAALSAFEFEVACGGESVAAGTLSTWLTPTGA
jgi:predicted hotdog family 3-hydroxylacyl-ACP dehydratase